MKLCNKKTGKIGELSGVNRIVVYEPDMPLCGNSILGEYDTLAKLNEEWEDYKPTEPLIKDKKVRKFVLDWAEHWKIDKVIIRFIDSNRIDLIGFPSPSSTKTGREIDIQRTVVRNEIIYGNKYTIDELCGEEKE